MSTQRLFIALNLPQELHAAIERVQNRLRYISGASSVRWALAGQFHVTLEFLGDIETERAPEIVTAVKSACAGEGPLALTLDSAGCFPSFSKPSVVWVDVSGDVLRLCAIQNRIRNATRRFANRVNTHEFSPHLTIGRIKNTAFRAARATAPLFGKALEVESKKIGQIAQWSATRVHLMRSELKGAAVYSEVGHIDLIDGCLVPGATRSIS